jgi:putative redox protein
MITVRAEFGAAPRAQVVTLRHHRLIADEQADLGGADAGPTPSELLLAALASCVAVTLQMYAGRKGWDLRQARVEVNGRDEAGRYVIERRLTLEGDLDAEQRARLTEIAGRCPVSKRLMQGVDIRGVE